MKVFLTAKLLLRPPTGRKKRVLEEAARLYSAAINAALAVAAEQRTQLEALDPKKLRGRYVAGMIDLPPGPWDGLHSSLRQAATDMAAATVCSYLALRQRAEKLQQTPPTWPTEAEPAWGRYEYCLEQFRILADDLAQENALRNELLACGMAVKATRRRLGDVLWFPRMDGARRARNAALLTDGKNYWVLMYLLAPSHPLAALIRGDGRFREVGAEPWTGHSKCAIVLPVEVDSHPWQRQRFLEPAERGELDIQTGQLYRERNGDWVFAVNFARNVELRSPTKWLGVAFVGDLPVVMDAAGGCTSLPGHGLAIPARVDARVRADLQRRGRDISYRRPVGQAAREMAYRWANAIVAEASQRDCGVVMATMKPRPGTPRARLEQALAYKLAEAGLPLRHLSAKELARWCPSCGSEVPKAKEWLCPGCGLALPGSGVAVGWGLAIKAEEKFAVSQDGRVDDPNRAPVSTS